MCAILGWVNYKETLNDKVLIFQDMLNLMDCRGNDDTGYYIKDKIMLGHKRLAIMDLENGHQPMKYMNYTIVFNGEIYNAESIRSDLINYGYNFDGHCDTEVIIKGFHCFGFDILNKLEGIFAFCIYDSEDGSLFLARDRFGVKPLYYSLVDNNFIFSSSIKSILQSGVVDPIIDVEKLGEVLALGPSKSMGSGIFKGISELRPAHYMIFKRGKLRIKRYWNVVSKKCNDTFGDAKRLVNRYLTNSIKRQMTSDVDIATLLSGGLDSSIITAVVALNKDDTLTTYSIDYEDNDKYFKGNKFQVARDNDFIKIMSDRFSTYHISKVISQDDVVKYLKDTLVLRDYPGMIDIDSSLYWFSKEISNDYKVILSGECADEIFGGYPWFYRDELNERKSFPWINNVDYRESLIKSSLRKKLNIRKILSKEYNRTIRELRFKDRFDKYKRLFYINMTHFMTTLLDRKDRMTMGATIEARVPFADTKLVEYLWNLPFSYKYKDGKEKYLLKCAFEDIIPAEILNRKKNPYPKSHNPVFCRMVSDLLRKKLENKDSVLYKIFDIDMINKLLDDDSSDEVPWFGQLMMRPQLIAYLYQFDLWFELYDIKLEGIE